MKRDGAQISEELFFYARAKMSVYLEPRRKSLATHHESFLGMKKAASENRVATFFLVWCPRKGNRGEDEHVIASGPEAENVSHRFPRSSGFVLDRPLVYFPRNKSIS